MTEQQIIEKAMQSTIMDAMEKGHTDKDSLIAYMSSEVFDASVGRYTSIIKDEIASLAQTNQLDRRNDFIKGI